MTPLVTGTANPDANLLGQMESTAMAATLLSVRTAVQEEVHAVQVTGASGTVQQTDPGPVSVPGTPESVPSTGTGEYVVSGWLVDN